MSSKSCKDLSVHRLLEAIVEGKEQDKFPYEILENEFPPKVVMSKMEKLSHKDILDYGVSLRTAWPVQEYLEKHHPDLARRMDVVRLRPIRLPVFLS